MNAWKLDRIVKSFEYNGIHCDHSPLIYNICELEISKANTKQENDIFNTLNDDIDDKTDGQIHILFGWKFWEHRYKDFKWFDAIVNFKRFFLN